MEDYNYCSNRTGRDPTAKAALNKDRLGYCQHVIKLFTNFLDRHQYKVVGLEIWDIQKKKFYKGRDFDL